MLQIKPSLRVFNAIPTGGASILATPIALLILGAAGFIIGLVAGIIGSLIADNWPKTPPDAPGSMTPSVKNNAFFNTSKQINPSSHDKGDELVLAC